MRLHLNRKKLGVVVVCTCHPSDGRKTEVRPWFRFAWQKVRPYPQNNQSKKSGGVVQVLEHLSSKCEALSSNPSTEKAKRNFQFSFSDFSSKDIIYE
jgi:hypothetical protein